MALSLIINYWPPSPLPTFGPNSPRPRSFTDNYGNRLKNFTEVDWTWFDNVLSKRQNHNRSRHRSEVGQKLVSAIRRKNSRYANLVSHIPWPPALMSISFEVLSFLRRWELAQVQPELKLRSFCWWISHIDFVRPRRELCKNYIEPMRIS